MRNPINISGNRLETDIRNWLDTNSMGYTKSKEGPKGDIDYIIHSMNGDIYIECANQNSKGSVMDKIPHKVFKYWIRYRMKEIYIVRGKWQSFSESILEHLEHLRKTCSIDIKIVSFEEIINVLKTTEIKENKFF